MECGKLFEAVDNSVGNDGGHGRCDRFEAGVDHSYPVTSTGDTMMAEEVLEAHINSRCGMHSHDDFLAVLGAPKIDYIGVDFFNIFVSHFCDFLPLS